MSATLDRRQFVATLGAAAGAAVSTTFPASTTWGAQKDAEEATFGFGLVTYMWGAQWDLPTLLKNCRETNVLGVELRTTHKHGVEPSLEPQAREDVRNQFADSGITLVGLGSNERFDHPDPEALAKAVEATKEFIRLSHDVGGSGVKVKPDSFQPNVPPEQTIEQIGKTLNELGEYAAGFGQQLRLEVHGKCAELPTIKAIMDIATDENVAVCWNSNPTDLKGDGLEANFNLVAKRFGQTLHVHELERPSYPYPELFELLVEARYEGWVLLEAAEKRDDYVAALAEQKRLFDRLLKAAQG